MAGGHGHSSTGHQLVVGQHRRLERGKHAVTAGTQHWHCPLSPLLTCRGCNPLDLRCPLPLLTNPGFELLRGQSEIGEIERLSGPQATGAAEYPSEAEPSKVGSTKLLVGSTKLSAGAKKKSTSTGPTAAAPLPLLEKPPDVGIDRLVAGRGISFAFLRHVSAPISYAFAHSIPNDAALDALAARAPLCEIGAGSGYWGKLLKRRVCMQRLQPSPPRRPVRRVPSSSLSLSLL